MQTQFNPNNIIGLTAHSFSRVLYEFNGVFEEDDGDLIIDFGTTSIWLSSAPPYDILAIKDGTWKDPFENATDSVNVKYIAEHGKLSLRCCDSISPLSECVGSTLVSVSKLICEYGNLAGLGLRFESGSFYFYIGGDESLVSKHVPTGFTKL